MRISMFMAMDRNKLVGRQGTMPWKIASDLKYFKRMTMSRPLIMGRVTFDSLGGILPGRPHIVITRDQTWSYDGVIVVHSLEDGIEVAKQFDSEEMMIIGGANICAQAIPLTERLYLTVIDHEFAGDRWLECFDWKDWKTVSQQENDETEQGGYRFTYYILESAGTHDT